MLKIYRGSCHCGVRPFGVGNDTPIGRMYGVNLGCLEDVSDEELSRIAISCVDGRNDRVAPSPTDEDLVVLYFPEAAGWQAACDRMQNAGFRPVKSFNPYRDVRGRTFQDPDGYRVVIQLERPA